MKEPILTREQRLEVYKQAYEIFKEKPVNRIAEIYLPKKYVVIDDLCYGMCHAIGKAQLRTGHIDIEIDRTNFPEFFSYKPKTSWKGNRDFWWSISKHSGGIDRRLKILERLSRGLSKGE